MAARIRANRAPSLDDLQNVTNDNTLDVDNHEASGQVDTSGSAKARRKRTSPRDHAILESAYQHNSKPDKEERSRLVAQVELTEKEVQIWFQNRRQNDRRKSKPLAPHELIPHFRNGVPEEAISRQLPSPFNSQERPAQSSPSESQARNSFSSPNRIRDLLNNDAEPSSISLTEEEQLAMAGGSGAGSQQVLTPPSSAQHSGSKAQPDALRSQERVHTAPTHNATTSSLHHVTKKRSHEEMTEHDRTDPALDASTQAAKSLRRTSSFLQLALSHDGSAKVKRSDETTPSPPKERPQPPPNVLSRRSSGFTRAQSDLSSSFQFRDVSAMKGPPGRSRDARTWEFFCDRNSRSTLAARAEQEASGSAVGAIGLVRSASGRRMQPLASNGARRNQLRQSMTTAKVKPTLARAQSSMARLQSSGSLNSDDDPKNSGHRRQSSGSESDKENWMPGTRNSQGELRRTEPSRSRTNILQEHDDSIVPHGHQSPRLPSGNDQENRAHRSKGNGKGKGGDYDIDCVKSLLSLSQGAWR